MISFLSSTFFWALPLVIVPVLIHIFSRRRRNIVQWGAMRFLIEAISRRRRVWRITDILLMLIRIVVVLLLVLAISRPVLQTKLLGLRGLRDVTIVVDNSMSTAVKGRQGSILDWEIAETGRVIDKLRDGDTVRVMLAASPPEWLVSEGVPMNVNSKRRIRSLLYKITPAQGAADMMLSLRDAASSQPTGENATRVVILVTDSQAYGWRTDATKEWSTLDEGFSEIEPQPVINVLSHGKRDQPVTNLSVSGLEVSRSRIGKGDIVTLTATVRNTGEVATGATVLEWRIPSAAEVLSSIPALQPGEESTATIEQSFSRTGSLEIVCRLQRPDDLDLDNEEHAIIEVVSEIPVLIVDGLPRADPLNTGTGFLLAALGQKESTEEWNSAIHPKVIGVSALPGINLSDYECVLLANVSLLPGETISALEQYVRSGGGLWIVLGSQTDRNFFNSNFYKAGSGLSPLPVGEPTGNIDDRETFVQVNPPSLEHPATTLLADTERLDIHRVRVYRRFMFDSPELHKETEPKKSIMQLVAFMAGMAIMLVLVFIEI